LVLLIILTKKSRNELLLKGKKYKNYISHTIMSSTGLTEVIKYFEDIENLMESD